MEFKILIGYDDGKDLQGIQRDIPVLTAARVSDKKKDKAEVNCITGSKATKVFEELTNFTESI